ncbi:MAG: hypothetical protein M3Q33_15110 [Acidobacteriota bacterium]|nr:hypothetical protein [Acidobacteriota bacterium]
MLGSNLKNVLTGFILILLAGSFTNAGAQTPSDKQISLLDRVRSVTRSLPKEILPPQGEVKLNPVRPGLVADSPPIFEVAAPEKTAAGTIDGALYIRRTDGDEKKIIVKPLGAKKWDVEGAIWSPDGKLIDVFQLASMQ